MFPSILKRHAETLMSSEGVYSSEQRRRIMTDSMDWTKCNFSIERAAECMTPALLYGFKRVVEPGHSFATLERDDSTSNSALQGFLIFGLTREALCCLDHLYEKDGPKHLFTDRQGNNTAVQKWEITHSTRKDVKVKLATSDGTMTSVDASAYFPVNEATQGPTAIQWDLDRFVSSDSFNRLSNAGNQYWMNEERNIAILLGIQFVLPGDELVYKIRDHDMDGMRELIHQGLDVNAPSARFKFRSPLQAAAHYRNEDAAWYLIKKGADVDTEGGEYRTALIAAVVQGEEGIVRLLLGKKANLFTGGGSYISALYQAVNQQDVDMTQLLLENGAWLTDDYNELLDLASERGNNEVRGLLEQYDVRGLHLKQGLPSTKHRQHIQGGENKRSITKTAPVNPKTESSEVGSIAEVDRRRIYQAALGQWLFLKGTEGKWTELKGVKLLQTCFTNGLQETFFDKNLLKFQRLIKYVPNLTDFGREFTAVLGSKVSLNKIDSKDTDKQYSGLSQEGKPIGSGSNNRLTVPSSVEGGRRRSRSDPKPPKAEKSDNKSSLKPPQDSRRSRSASINSSDPYLGDGRNSSRSSHYEDDEPFCLACDGRGGRRGTSIRCAECKGQGAYWSESRRRMRDCRVCRGSGRTYTERDGCKACGGTGGGSG